MTSAETLAALEELAKEMPAHVQRGSTKEIGRFTSLLATVDDFPPSDFTRAAIDQLRQLTDHVVEQVETAIDLSDSPRRQQKLAATVYVLRRRLEDIEMWFRHFGGSRAP